MKIFRSFYGRISLLFLAMILFLGAGSLLIAFNASQHLFDEVEQLLNREYAGSIALELEPLVSKGFSKDTIGEAIHYMMVLNPMVEIYLLDSSGVILAYFTHPKETLKTERIDTEPIDNFISSQGFQLVLGDDPRSPDTHKPFSAARLDMGGESGYVYVILRGQSYDRSHALARGNYYLRSGLTTFLIALLVTSTLGLSLFFFLTRPLKILSSAVKSFEAGDYDMRVHTGRRDEISDLSLAFNDMAGSIQNAMTSLRESEKQRTDLLANISHDLRSPLTSMRGHLEMILMKEENLDQATQREFVETVLRNVESLQVLVEELFDLARLESRQMQLRMEEFSLAELVQDVIIKRKAPAEKRGISVHYSPPADSSYINGDIALVERVLTNILDNALTHTPDGGQIRFSLKTGDRALVLDIEDSGPGIPDEDLPYIFERFYRADKSRSRDLPGTGLGLAIALEIMTLHGGSVGAVNSSSGGALFSLKFKV